jgi:carboxymethylenebutenolidase
VDKSSRHLEWINLKHGDRTVKAFIAFPEVKEKVTAVVVIHEIFGHTEWVQSLTDQLAEAGYIAISPDLLTGKGPNGGGTAEIVKGGGAARGVIGSLPPDQITADLNAAVEYVAKHPACNGKVVVAGFCYGGRETFRFATNHKDVKAGFVFYGEAPTSEAALTKITAPIYGFYAENDARINGTLPATTEAMKKLNKKFEPVTYEGAGHGFMRAGEDPAGNDANKKAREDAWVRWKALLKGI